MAEQLAPWTSACPDRAFTVGLFSLLGALVKRPLPDVLDQLPFDERTTTALLHGHEPEGRLLRAIEAHERGETLPVDTPPPPGTLVSGRGEWSDAMSAALI